MGQSFLFVVIQQISIFFILICGTYCRGAGKAGDAAEDESFEVSLPALGGGASCSFGQLFIEGLFTFCACVQERERNRFAANEGAEESAALGMKTAQQVGGHSSNETHTPLGKLLKYYSKSLYAFLFPLSGFGLYYQLAKLKEDEREEHRQLAQERRLTFQQKVYLLYIPACKISIFKPSGHLWPSCFFMYGQGQK